MQTLEPPPPPPYAPQLITFTKSEYENASLTCSTEIQSNKTCFGFTALMDFYPSDELSISSAKFQHDQENFQVVSNLENGEKLKMDFRYNTFIKMNFEVKEEQNTTNNMDVKMTFVVNCTPLFYMTKTDKEKNFSKYIRFNPRSLAKSGIETWNFWDSMVGATAYQMEFNISKSELFSFLNQLDSLLSCALTFHLLWKKTFDSSQINSLNINEWPWEVRYRIEAIKCWTIGCYFLNYFLFVKNEITNIFCENNNFNESWANVIFTAMFDYLKSDLSLSNLDDFNPDNYSIMGQNLNGGVYVLMKTVYVTPTRMILALDEATMNCRGFRKIGVEKLIQIKFRDDNLSFFPRERDCIANVILPICQYGINIAGRNFYELGGSSSLFREHGSYFIAAEKKEDVIGNWRRFGNFKVEQAAKVHARIGQHFTSAREIRFKLRQSNVLLIDDFMSEAVDSANKNYCFSDGVGIIDEAFAYQIAAELEIPYIPSAFQIRFAGFKGMVSVDKTNPNLIKNGGKYFACLRESQKKFGVEDPEILLDFDIVKWSAPAPANLHRSFIVMLDAHARREGKQEDFHKRLHHLLNDCSMNVLSPLLENQSFIATLEKLPKYFPIEKMARKNLMEEQFLRSMVEAQAVLNAKMLSSKIQIPIPIDLGRAAFGIIDTTGTLGPDEVYFQFSKTINSKSASSQKTLKLGRVGITKSPIYHAGDIQFLTAVDAPALSHLCDVLVFSSKGTRPYTDMIGGGDLDGDQYTIFWDPAFLFDNNIPAADYTAVSADPERIPNVNLDELQEHFPPTRCYYIIANNLEYLSNCHLAHLISHDPNHEDCENIAKKADTAVNFFKSGVASDDIGNDEKHIFWPKFMGKRHEPAFTNSHILCQLYDRAKSFYDLIQIAQREAVKLRRIDKQPEAAQVADISVFDQKLYKTYKFEIQALLKKHGINSEGELFANAFLDVQGTLKAYKDPLGDDGSATALIQREVFGLFEKYRSKILDRFGFSWRTDMQMKCENIFSYKLKIVPNEMIELAKKYYALADGECYSFPWIAWEGLDAWWSLERRNVSLPATLLPIENYVDFFNFAIEAQLPEWYLYFLVEVTNWETQNGLDSRCVSNAIDNFKFLLTQEKVDRSKILLENGAFFYFLVSITYKNNTDEDKSAENQQLYKTAKSTLTTHAFMPGIDILAKNTLCDKIIPFPSFVISIPEYWCPNFEKDYSLLEQYSGCQEVAIGLRRSTKAFSLYTILCRGTYEACKKLENMLTPVIEADFDASMKEMKAAKITAMNKLLRQLFNFPTLKHAESAPGRMNYPNPLERRSQKYSKKFKRPSTGDYESSEGFASKKRKPSANL